jgi:FkbH-like protein
MTLRTLVITANFTAEPLVGPLSFLTRQLGMLSSPEVAPYNQVFQQLLDASSVCRRNQDGVNVILVRLEDWGKFQRNDNGAVVFPPEFCENIKYATGDFVSALKSALGSSSVPHLVVICPHSRVALEERRVSDCLAQMEQLIDCEFSKLKGVQLVRPDALAATYPVRDYDDPEADRHGHIPYTQPFFVALAAMVARRVYSLTNVPHKVIALDCDQTLWTGVCGEDGPSALEIDLPRIALQKFMVHQYEAGMLLCLCSKNNEEDVFEVFERRPEMPLKLEHIVSVRINWKSKSENLRSLAAELNLGLDSFIFVDDDAAVCAEVRANCPEVLTLQLPQESAQIEPFLQNVWAFDHFNSTLEDKERTALYKVNVEREQLRSQSESLQDFLSGLGLKIAISPLLAPEIPRVSQLTQRTNQFNFTTIRRSESQIDQIHQTGPEECLVVSVSDRFGDYGLVGVMIFEPQRSALVVETLLLSCRALGRGVEHRMMAQLGAIALERGLEYVEVKYLETAKNRPAYEFISQIGPGGEIHKINGGALFRIPSSVAATIKLDSAPQTSPGLTGDSPERTLVSQLAQANGSPPISIFLARVPEELSTVDQISHALMAEKSVYRQADIRVVAPQDEVQSRLRDIWEDVLGVNPIGVDDNYFDLGGDSFQAVRIFAEIEKLFGKHLLLVTLLEAPTIKQFARLLREPDSRTSWSPLVPIQPNGPRPPFYCMHAAGGDVLFYRDLARHLGLDQPLYGLQARGNNRTETTHDNVEEMAAHYLSVIRAFQTEGPYYLGGSSFGGLVAFEMARQLEQDGVNVALLALFDTYGPGYPKLLPKSSTLARTTGNWIQRAQGIYGTLKLLRSEDKVRYLVAKTAKVKKKLLRKFLWKKNEMSIAFNSATGRPLPKDIQRNHKAIEQAMRNYIPEPYGGPLTVFRAATQPSGVIRDDSLGWQGLALGGLELHEVPGFHGAVTVDPHAKFLAEKLMACLSKAQLDFQQAPFKTGSRIVHDKSYA